jgi:hypothetical protein
MRLTCAFLFAPAVPAVVSAVATGVPGLLDLPFPGPGFPMSLFYAYPAALFVGVPLYLFYEKKNWLKLWSIVASCAVIGGALPLLVIGSFIPLEEYSKLLSFRSSGILFDSALTILVGTLLGALSGSVFWFIGFRRK